ncbi:TPA: hypothetical protein DEG21_03705 [Patescibacteria group bacterium]|nr:hypothetical protein [Candidatus Gracilibacteria bacterium]HBY74957.1 hypothetical protein [Candidatus Gracilibacteria bacterium]
MIFSELPPDVIIIIAPITIKSKESVGNITSDILTIFNDNSLIFPSAQSSYLVSEGDSLDTSNIKADELISFSSQESHHQVGVLASILAEVSLASSEEALPGIQIAKANPEKEKTEIIKKM